MATATAEPKLDDDQGVRRLRGPGRRYLSYYGLRPARARHARPLVGRRAPRRVAKAEIYLSLGRVYMLSSKTSRALEALEQGCRLYPDDPALKCELVRLERRARPPIPGLDRSHAVNRGLIRSWRFLARLIKKR